MATKGIYNYIKNVTTSVKYAAIEKFEEITPAPVEFVRTNSELFKEIRDTANSMRVNYKKIGTQIQQSKVYDAADGIIRNVFSDLRTGKFYNKERKDKAGMEAFGLDMDMDSGMGDSDWMNDDWQLDNDSEYLGGMMDQVGAKSTTAICETIAATSNAVSQNIRGSTQLLYTQSIQTNKILQTGLSSVSDNTGKLVQFSNDVIRTHVENSTKFYQTSTDIQNKQLEILQKIYEEIKTEEKPKRYGNNNTLNYSSITSGGIVDLREYIKLIKKNASNKSAGTLDMLSSFGDPLKLVATMGASPLEIIPKTVVNAMISSNAEKILQEFNNTFSGLFGSIIMKANDLAVSSNNDMVRNIAEMLGIRSSLKKELSAADYEKGAMKWNGKANKALIEVIPTYLAKIEAAISGQSERLYDYESGRFISAKDIKKSSEDRFRSRALSSTSEMRSHFTSESRYIQFNSTKEQEQFQKDIDNFFVALFEKGKIFNFHETNIDNKFSQYGVSSKNNFIIIKNMFMNSPIGMQMMINNNILAGRDSYNKMMSDLQNQGTDITLSMYNDSGIFASDDISETRNKLSQLLDLEKTYTDRSTAKYKVLIKEIDKLRENLIKNKNIQAKDKTKDNIFNKYVDDRGNNIFYYLQHILLALNNGTIGDITSIPGGTSSILNNPIDEDLKRYELRRDVQLNQQLRETNARNRNDNKTGNHYISSNQVMSVQDYAKNVEIRKEYELKEENKRKYGYLIGLEDPENASFMDKLNKASNPIDAVRVIGDTLSRFMQKPLDAFTKLTTIADKKIYNLFYGGPIKMENGQKVEGILGLMSYHIKDTFTEVKNWVTDTFGGLFKNKDGSSKINLSKIFGNNIGSFFKNMGTSISGYIRSAGKSTADLITNALNKPGWVGKKTRSIDELTVGGKSIKDYFDGKHTGATTDEELIEYAYKNSDIIEGITKGEKANLKRYITSKKKYSEFTMGQFANLNKSAGLNIYDAQTFKKLMEPYLKNMALGEIGTSEKEVKNNLLKNNNISLENLFGRIITDENGVRYHDKYDSNRIIKDDALYQKYMDFMNQTGFSQLIGTDNYTLSELFNQQKDSTEVISDTIVDIYKEAQENAKSTQNFYNNTNTFQSQTIGYMDQIVALLYKISGEEHTNAVDNTFKKIKETRLKEAQERDKQNRKDADYIRYIRTLSEPYQNANGARYITESGITAISKGELIIPSDKNPFNPDRNKVNRAQEIANEKRIIRDFAKHKTPFMNAEGNDISRLEALLATQFALQNNNLNENIYDQIINSIESEEENESNSKIHNAAKAAGNAFNKAIESLTGKTLGKNSNAKLQAALDDAKNNIGPYAGKMAAGGLAGAFSFGALFGGAAIPGLPLIGAALGAGSSLVASSDKFKEWLFGIKEDGEFKDGLIPPSIVNWFAKNGKQLGSLSLGGAVAGGLLGHPLIGLMLGAGAGIVNSSERFRDYMFGEEGLIKPATQKKIMKGLKTAAIGTIGANLLAPSIMGSLGFLPQVILGTAGGFLASSDKFQEFIFGRKNDATGKYEHGLLPAIRKVTIEPLGRMMHGIEEKLISFIKNDVVKPFQVFFEPLNRIKKKSLEFIKESFGKLFEKAGTGLSDMFKSTFGPLLEKFKSSDLYRGIQKTFSAGKKIIGTLINPLKWMELAGKGMGNIVGALGGMNHLTNEQYQQRYGIFGKTLKRKGQRTIDSLEEADLTKSQYQDILGNLKAVNMSKGERIKKQKEAATNLKNKIYDTLGGDSTAIKAAQDYAKYQNLDSDEANTQLNMLTLEAYRQKYVGKDRKQAFLEMDSSAKVLTAMLRNMGNSEEMIPKAMRIIKKTANIDEIITKLNEAGIIVTPNKKQKFLKEVEYYKKQHGMTKAHTTQEWEAMSDDEKLDVMKNDTSFDNEKFATGLRTAAKEYQRDTIAVTDSEAMQEELNNNLRSMGINPDKLNSKQIQEILEGQYKNKMLHGGFREEENPENTDEEVEQTEAIHTINDTITSKTDEMIDLLKRIADHLADPTAVDRLHDQHNAIQDAVNNDELSDDDIDSMIINNMEGNNSVEDASRIKDYSKIKNRKIKLGRRFADLSLTTTGHYNTSEPLVQTDADTGDLPEQEQTSFGSRLKRLLYTPIGRGKMSEFKGRLSNLFHQPIVESNANGRGPEDYDALSAVSAGELIIDASKFGYDNKTNRNKIWSFANGTPTMDSISLTSEQKKELEEKDKQEKEHSEKLLDTLERVNQNTKQTRQAFASDEEVKKNRGKIPSFLNSMMGKFGSVFSFAKLASKAKILAIGAGILLAPMLNKILGAVVPFLTEKVLPAIAEALPGIIDKVGSLIPSLINMITTAVPDIVDVLANKVIPSILQTLPSILNGATDIIKSLGQALPKILEPLLNLLPVAIKNVFSDIIPTLVGLIPQLIEGLTSNLGNIIQSLIEGLISSIGSIIQNLPSIVLNVLKGIRDAGAGIIKGLFGGLFGGSGLSRKLNIKTKTNHKIDTNYEMPKKFIENMNAAGRGLPARKKSSMLSTAASGITSFFKGLFKSKKSKSDENSDGENTSNIETYTDGRSYLDGKQINPIMAHISQNSERYKNRSFSIPLVDKGITLGSDGCGVMSGAMVINSLTGQDTVTPEKVADYALLTGGKAAGGGIKAGFFKSYFKKFDIDTTYHDLTDENNKPKETSGIINALKQNKPVILMGRDSDNTGNTPFPDNNHYVVATGISEDGSKVILNDPYKALGGDVYNLNDVLNKTMIGIEASKSGAGLSAESMNYTKKTETNNTYGKVKNSSTKLIVKPIQTNAPTVNLNKRFDPYAYQDLGKYNPITEEEMNNFINYWCSKGGHTEFVGHGDIFLKAAEETGLDPRYILAHAATESGWGSSRICKEKGNYFGIAAYNDSPYESAKTFGTDMETGIIEGAKWIKRNYYDAGQKSIYEMIYGDPNHRYAVFDDGSPNWEWIDVITDIIRRGPNVYTDPTVMSGSGKIANNSTHTYNNFDRDKLRHSDKQLRSMVETDIYGTGKQVTVSPTTSEGLNDIDFTKRSNLKKPLTGLEAAINYYKKSYLNDSNITDNMLYGGENVRFDNSENMYQYFRDTYFSPYLDNYYDSTKQYVSQDFSVSNNDSKFDILRYLYGQEMEIHNDKINGDDANALNVTHKINKAIYKQMVRDEWTKNGHINDFASEEDIENELNSMADSYLDQNIKILGKLLPRLKSDYRSGTTVPGDTFSNGDTLVHPFLWKNINFDEIKIGNDTYKNTKFYEIEGANLLLREFVYNPSMILDEYSTGLIIDDYARNIYPNDNDKYLELSANLNEFASTIREKGLQLTPEQTEQIYKSPTFYKFRNKLIADQFGSNNLPDYLHSSMQTFKDLVKPDLGTINSLDQQDTELHEIIKNGLINSPDEFIRKVAMGNVTGLTEEEQLSLNAKANAAANAQEQINEIYTSNGESEGTTKEPFSLIDFLRNIGTFFSSVFDRIADIIFGGGTWGTIGDQQVNSHTAGNNNYGYDVELQNTTTIFTKKNPIEYASAEAKKKSVYLQEFAKMNHPNGIGIYTSKWMVDVCGRAKNTDDYFLIDGYTINIPRSDIVNGYDGVQDIDTSSKSSNTAEKSLTTLDVIGRPDQYGDANASEILKKISARNIPDSLEKGGLWKLNVTGKDGNDGYYLSDGTKVVIPKDKINNYSSVGDIPVYKPVGNTGASIYDLVSNATSSTASDDFFTKSFQAQGFSGYKTSNGPDMDTMNAYRVHSGIDYATGGTNPNIYSPISGTVTRDYPGSGTGNYLVIKEDGKTDGVQRYHRFMHMLNGSPFVKTGDYVEQGDLIGQVGNTGASYGEHLHYDIADEAGLKGSLSREYVRDHFVEPNQYLDKYFKNHESPTGTKIHETTRTTSSSTSGKGGDHETVKGINDIYEAILEIISYLMKITTNTGLIGDIVTLLTSIDNITSNKNLTPEQKAKKVTVARETLQDKVRQLSMTLNSSNNETTGHSSMVEAMNFIASM